MKHKIGLLGLILLIAGCCVAVSAVLFSIRFVFTANTNPDSTTQSTTVAPNTTTETPNTTSPATEPTSPTTTAPVDTEPSVPMTTVPVVTEPTEPIEPTEPAHTHNWGEWEIVNEATCDKSGVRQRLCECGEADIETIEMIAHNETVDPAVAPTCTEDGLSEGMHCSVCGEIIVAQIAIPATGHSFGEWTVTEESTCVSAGSRQRSCACGEIETEATGTTAHTEVTVPGVTPTCTEGGLSEGKHCSICGEIIVIQTAIPATGHSYGAWTVTKAATCNSTGSRQRSCACGKTETETIAKTEHTEVTDPAVAPTCTETGLTEGKHCSSCGKVITAQTSVPATGHNFSEWEIVWDASCILDGYEDRTCHCGEYESRSTPATGHTFIDGECACGQVENGGFLWNLDIDMDILSVYWSDGYRIVVHTAEGDYMLYTFGEILAGPYDGMLCVSPNGYVVAWNQTQEVIDTIWVYEPEYDFETGEHIEGGYYADVVKTTVYSYLLDYSGEVVYETVSTSTEYPDFPSNNVIYEGEMLVHFNDYRIVTIKYDNYYAGMASNACTLYIYSLRGTKYAEIPEVMTYGNFINDELVFTSHYGIGYVDNYGNVTYINEEWYMDRYEITTGHHTAFFTDGYILIASQYSYGSYYPSAYLISKDGQTIYSMNRNYLYNANNYGTLVFSKVLIDGQASSNYYLIDVSKCAINEYGMIIPTLDAAVNDTPVVYGNFSNIFGKIEKYALISTEDGRWGYMSYDGQIVKLYDDACAFSNGYAAVKEGDKFYIIDEDFKRVSDYITGYDSVSTVGNGIFLFKNSDTVELYEFFPYIEIE